MMSQYHFTLAPSAVIVVVFGPVVYSDDDVEVNFFPYTVEWSNIKM